MQQSGANIFGVGKDKHDMQLNLTLERLMENNTIKSNKRKLSVSEL